MKSKCLLLLSFLIIMACGESPKVAKKPVAERPVENLEKKELVQDKKPPIVEKSEVEELLAIDLAEVYGHYVGMFKALEYDDGKEPSWYNKINITIEKIDGEKVEGYSVVAGNARPFEGIISEEGHEIKIIAKEPGDDRYDGKFDFSLNPTKSELVGYWFANDKKLAVTKREYHLKKRRFEYNPNVTLNEDFLMTGLYGSYREVIVEDDLAESFEEESLTQDVLAYNASTTLLKKDDVENMYQADLEVLRNAIYARHGYSFKNRRMRYLFDQYVDWYIPMKTNILADLTDIEKQNIELLKRYEQHAEKYYDVFGR